MPALKTCLSYTTLDETDRRVAAVIVCGGSSSRMDKSKSPKIISASVLGIGVALITSTCGFSPFSKKFFL